MATHAKRSGCPVACTLDILGDQWTLIVLRDLLIGKHRFGEFLGSPEGIPTNILTARLNRLLENGLITKKPYQRHPVRNEYHLTPKGRGLLPVLQEMCRWANAHITGTWVPPKEFMEMRP